MDVVYFKIVTIFRKLLAGSLVGATGQVERQHLWQPEDRGRPLPENSALVRNERDCTGGGAYHFFPKNFPNFPDFSKKFEKVWKSLEKFGKSFGKLFQTFSSRRYYFNAII